MSQRNSVNTRSRAYKRIRARRARKRRQLIIKFATFAVVVIVATFIVRNVTKNQHYNVAGVTDQAVDAENYVASNNETDIIITNEPVLKYAGVSAGYEEIISQDINSQYIAVLDINNNEIVSGRGYDTKIYPASMTKVMTLIVAVEQLKDMNETYTFTNELLYPLVKENASRAGFDPEEVIGVKDLLYGLILPSGADAADALAMLVSGSIEGYADLMNEKCRQLGLKNTHFTNPSGLHDDNQYTTPMEMAMIMKYAMSDVLCATVLSTYQYTTEATPQHPEGILLTSTMFSRMYGTEVEGTQILAGKVGYTTEAGNCLVSYAVQGDNKYVAVTAGANYKWYPIFDTFELYRNYTAGN